MTEIVVDTNVIAVANSKSPHASSRCFDACIDALEAIQAGSRVVVDDRRRIIDEYLRHGSPDVIRGVGDAFVKWMLVHYANPSRCRQVRITPLADDPDDFEEFPRDADLARFDRSDRKFAAVARAAQTNPPILNAVDTDWWHHREAFARLGIRVTFLCPDYMAAHG